MVTNRSVRERIFDGFNYILLILVAIITLYPFLFVFFASLSDPTYVSQSKGLMLYPKGVSLAAYKMVMNNPLVGIGYRNTLLYVSVGTAISILLTTFGAYALSRKNLYGKNVMMFIIVFTMFFNGGLIPNYLMVRNLGIYNTMWALILPSAISTFNLIIMRTYFLTIHQSMEDSAKIDGANDFTILFRIMIPLAIPILAVMILFYAVYYWNSYFSAMIYLQTRTLYPLQLVLREILIQNSTDSMTTGIVQDRELVGDNVKYALVIVATVPILVIYPFLQKYFNKGIMIGAIKE